MTTRKKILFWAGAICLVAFAAWAANPSFSSFVTSQFSTSGNIVTIKQSATVTNMVARTFGGAAGLSVEDPFGIGIIFQVRDSGPTTQFYVDLDGSVNVNHSLNLAYSTASTLLQSSGSKNVSSIANGTGTLANDGSGGITFVDTLTNALPTASTFPVTSAWPPKQYLTNLAGGLTFTSVAGTDPNRVTQGVAILLPNGADRTLTLPADWVLPDGIRTITVTNGVTGVLSINCFGTKRTNATYRAYY